MSEIRERGIRLKKTMPVLGKKQIFKQKFYMMIQKYRLCKTKNDPYALYSRLFSKLFEFFSLSKMNVCAS